MTDVPTNIPPVRADANLFEAWLMGQVRGATEDWCDRCQKQPALNIWGAAESPFSLCEQFVAQSQGGCASYVARAKR